MGAKANCYAFDNEVPLPNVVNTEVQVNYTEEHKYMHPTHTVDLLF